jgi:hypothetical protein
MTEGEYRVGINFNPSNDDTVGRIKRLAADLIDLIDTLEVPQPDEDEDLYTPYWDLKFEVIRLSGLAKDAIENGAMWAVKAATKGPMA